MNQKSLTVKWSFSVSNNNKTTYISEKKNQFCKYRLIFFLKIFRDVVSLIFDGSSFQTRQPLLTILCWLLVDLTWGWRSLSGSLNIRLWNSFEKWNKFSKSIKLFNDLKTKREVISLFIWHTFRIFYNENNGWVCAYRELKVMVLTIFFCVITRGFNWE